MEDELRSFLISTRNGGEWSASRLGCCTPSERDPYCLWMVARWVPGCKNSLPIFLLFIGKLQLSTVSQVLQGKTSWGSSGKRIDLLSTGQGKFDSRHGPVHAKAYLGYCRMRRPTVDLPRTRLTEYEVATQPHIHILLNLKNAASFWGEWQNKFTVTELNFYIAFYLINSRYEK